MNDNGVLMNNINKKVNKLNYKIIILIIIGLAIAYSTVSTLYIMNSVKYSSIKYTNADVISMSDVKIAYVPESKQIIFLNRNTNQVRFVLSDSVSTSIMALKSYELAKDYKSLLKNKYTSTNGE